MVKETEGETRETATIGEDGHKAASTLKDLAEILVRADSDTLDMLTNLPIRQVHPLSKIKMHLDITKILAVDIGKYQKWIDSRTTKYGGRSTKSLTEYEVALGVDGETGEAVEVWLKSYLRYRRAVEGELQNHIVSLAEDQMAQEKPMEISPIEQFQRE